MKPTDWPTYDIIQPINQPNTCQQQPDHQAMSNIAGDMSKAQEAAAAEAR